MKNVPYAMLSGFTEFCEIAMPCFMDSLHATTPIISLVSLPRTGQPTLGL
jgi:hypothetical protein